MLLFVKLQHAFLVLQRSHCGHMRAQYYVTMRS